MALALSSPPPIQGTGGRHDRVRLQSLGGMSPRAVDSLGSESLDFQRQREATFHSSQAATPQFNRYLPGHDARSPILQLRAR